MNTVPQPTPIHRLEAGVNVLLMGPTGTGKTYSVGTLVDSGVETFYLGLESGIEALLGYWTDRGKPVPANLHWNVLGATPMDFSALASQADLIGRSTQDNLYKVMDMTRAQNNRFADLLRVLMDFKDQRTSQSFGSVSQWDSSRAIVIDGLTGMSNFAMTMVIGQKPVKSQTDWGIAQQALEGTLRNLCDGCKCHFILIAHVERETDQVMGGMKITVSTLGRALPPKIPPMFSDVLFTQRTGTQWTWSTANSMADLKARNLPWAENITPDFKQIISKWQSRGGNLTPVK